MKTRIIAAAAAISLSLVSFAAPAPAQARCIGCWVGAAAVGGLAAGAIVAGAAARPYYPAYYAPGCFWTKRRVWTGWHWAWRTIRVCR